MFFLRRSLPSFLLGSIVVTGFLVANPSARAQLPKIFVASYGSDLNDGSRGSPKRNFQAAHDAVAASGQIVVLDTAGYGALTITKSVAVTVPPGVNGFITVSGANNNGVSVNASLSAVVSLRGLIIEGSNSSGSRGISGSVVGTLEIDDCAVRNFQIGLYFSPSVPAHLNATGSSFRNCNLYGVFISQLGTFAVDALLVGCQAADNFNNFNVTAVSGGTIDVTLADCFATGNNVPGGEGIAADGAGAIVRLDNCRITGNAFGTATKNSGQIVSRRNNTLEDNGASNATPPAYNAK